MPRSNRPRGRKAGGGQDEADDLGRLLTGWRRTETRRGRLWTVQPVAASQSVKSYLCPGCDLAIAEGVAHVVTWRADGVMGDAADLAGRRHWHTHCWNLA